ncbi:Rha family transcriptional regulator [Stenotrophomonas bentonitica]|uniref:Rha family transcriptional regulator n=1 Tax=Stenotrophomonas bentonitica TaxID=1450134 RepID=UPI0031BA950E
MNGLVHTDGRVTLTSLEIADLTGKRHDNVMRDIRAMLVELHGEGGVLRFEETQRNPQNGQSYPVFVLPPREVKVLVTGYSITLRAKVIDRLDELEKAATPHELSRLEILQIALEAEQGRLAMEAERDHAIATKAEIGSRREATAMATASAAVREAEKLRDQLGQNSRHATVIAVERAVKGRFPSNAYVPLRAWCKERGVSAVDVVDERYGTVKAWPAGAWLDVYKVDLAELFGTPCQAMAAA